MEAALRNTVFRGPETESVSIRLRARLMRKIEEREAAIKRETDELKALLAVNTDLTRQDKELTQRIETLTREIRERVSR